MPQQIFVAGRRVQWLMLILLALIAGGSIVASLVKPSEEIDYSESVVQTAFITAIAASLVIAIGRRAETERGRRTGIFHLFLLLITYVWLMAIIWADAIGLAGGSAAYSFLMSGMLFLIVVLLAGPLFEIAQTRSGRYAGWVGLTACTLSCICMLWGTWRPEKIYTEHVLEIGVALWILALLLAASLGGVGTDRHHWRWIGVASSLTAAALVIYDLIVHADMTYSHTVNLLAMIAAVSGQANLLFLAPLRGWQKSVAWFTLLTGALTAALFVVGDIVSHDHPAKWERFMIPACVCTACGSVAVALLTRCNAKPLSLDPILSSPTLDLTCPVCATAQSVMVGESGCLSCGLHFSINVQTPKCAECGYVLRDIISDRCPECGKPIPWKRGILRT